MRNLPIAENEQENNQATVRAVERLFKDGLKLNDMNVVSATRHPTGRNGQPGGVTVSLESPK